MPLFGPAGPPDVDSLTAKRDVRGLIEALGYEKDHVIRRRAADALGSIGDVRAVQPLSAALKDADSYVPERAACALGKIGDIRAVHPLIAALADPHPQTQSAAAAALAKMGAPAVEPLIGALASEDREVRCWVADALGKMADTRAVEALVAVLRDPDSEVRRRAAGALAKMADPRAVGPLVAALSDASGGVRLAAADALSSLGWKPDRGEAGGAYWVARQNWGRCARIGARAVMPLIGALSGTDSADYMVRIWATEALGKIGDARAVEPLIAALPDGTAGLSGYVADALGEIGDARAVDPLISQLGAFSAHHAAEALCRIGPPAVAPLIGALRGEESAVRRLAAESLGKIGDARAVEPLIAALRDADGRVRWGATEALGKIGSPAVEPLMVALRDTDTSPSAAEVLWRIGPPAVAPLIGALGDENRGLCVVAAKTLGKIEDPRAVEALRVSADAGGPGGPARDRYVPGQTEPEEYLACWVNVMKEYQEAVPFAFPVILVGFEDETLVERLALGSSDAKLRGAVQSSHAFLARNPVVRIGYPSVASVTSMFTGSPPDRGAGSIVVADARELKRMGATDISAVGLTGAEVEAIRSIFHGRCCPFFGMVQL
jgi:HEAT repeat protein